MGLTVPSTTTTPSGGTTNPPTTESSDTNQQDAFSQFMARMVNFFVLLRTLRVKGISYEFYF